MRENIEVRPPRNVVVIGYTGQEGLDWRKIKLPKKFPRTSVRLRETNPEPPLPPKP